jgi:hypothetical protein
MPPQEPDPDKVQHKPPDPNVDMPGPPLFDPDEIAGDEEVLPEGDAPVPPQVPPATLDYNSDEPPQDEIPEAQADGPRPDTISADNLDSTTLTTPGADPPLDVEQPEPFDEGVTMAQGPAADPEMETVVSLGPPAADSVPLGDIRDPSEGINEPLGEFPGEPLDQAAIGSDDGKLTDILEETRITNRLLERMLAEGITARVFL